MNDKLLLHKRVNILPQYVTFLNYIHPNYEIITNIEEYENRSPVGIIYNGSCSEEVLDKIKSITDNWIIVDQLHYDTDISTNEGLIKNLLPIHYIKLKNLKSNTSNVYSNISYESLLDKVKPCLLCNNINLSFDDSSDQSAYTLFAAILSTRDIFNKVYFTTVNKDNVSIVTSSVLTFLSKVQSMNIKGANIQYARLISMSNKRYGKHIKNAISMFIKYKTNKEISLYKMLSYLNKVK